MDDSTPEPTARERWTTQRCRQLLGTHAEGMSDDEVDQLSDVLYQLADIVCAAIMRLRTEQNLQTMNESA